MINGTLKGEIVAREMFEASLTQRGYCARIDISVNGWTAGEKTQTVYAVYFPDFMRRRMEFFMKPTTKYCTVCFEAMVVVPAQSAEKPAYIAIMANRIEA